MTQSVALSLNFLVLLFVYTISSFSLEFILYFIVVIGRQKIRVMGFDCLCWNTTQSHHLLMGDLEQGHYLSCASVALSIKMSFLWSTDEVAYVKYLEKHLNVRSPQWMFANYILIPKPLVSYSYHYLFSFFSSIDYKHRHLVHSLIKLFNGIGKHFNLWWW